MAEIDIVETSRGGLIESESERGEIRKMYQQVERACEERGMSRHWQEIEDCLVMVDRSMTKKDDEGRWMRSRRKNGDLDLSHPVTVTLKTMEIAERHKDKVKLDEVLVEAALLHDFFEDFDMAVGVFNVRYKGGLAKGAKVMGLALDVTKGTALDRRIDEGSLGYGIRRAEYDKDMDDKTRKYLIKDEEDRLLLEHVRKEALVGNYRPLVIKLADRLHNMETVDGLGDTAFVRTVDQTREEFVRLALEFGFLAEAEMLMKLCREAVARRSLKSGS